MEKIIILIFLLFHSIHNSLQSQVTISVFYESLCPDSIKFLSTQLYPTWKHFGGSENSSGNYFVIDYVPYGKANTTFEDDGKAVTACRHGPEECIKNKMHACAVKYLPKREITPLINCLVTTPNNCSLSDHVEKCVFEEGEDLLSINSQRTRNTNHSEEWYVPRIEIDGVYNEKDSKNCEKNFTAVICQKTKLCPFNQNDFSSSTAKISIQSSFYFLFLVLSSIY